MSLKCDTINAYKAKLVPHRDESAWSCRKAANGL